MSYLFLVVGLVLLIKGVNLLVDSASKMAKVLGVPAFIIGLSIVAFGTSAPEAAIGFLSGIKGANQITLGDVIGSSIINITVVIGLTAIIMPLKVESIISKREIPLSLFFQIALAVMLYTGLVLSRFESMLLLLGFIAFTTFIAMETKKILKGQIPESDNERELFELIQKEEVIAWEAVVEENAPQVAVEEKESKTKLIIMLFVGLASLIFGGNLVVDNGVAIARSLGLSEEFIGLTFIAFGTSLPELVTCIVAALRKEEEIAVGNVIGSNIFNIVFVLGLSGSINPIAANYEVFTDIAMMILASFLLLIPSYFRQNVSRASGVIYVSMYTIYLAFKISNINI